MRGSRRWFWALAVLVLSACAAREPRAAGSAPDRSVITEAELRAVESRTTALQLIERLHPTWLRGRGPVNPAGDEGVVVVYVNNQQLMGGPEQLRRYTAGELREIRRLSAMEATQRFGAGHTSGAILVTTR